MESKDSKVSPKISDLIKDKSLSKSDQRKLNTVSGLSAMLNGDEKLVSIMYGKMDGKYQSMRDLALNCDQTELCKFFHANQIPDSFPGKSKKEKVVLLAKEMEDKMFELEPSASIQKFITDKRIKLADKNVETGILKLLEDNPEFNLKSDSVLDFISDDKVMKNVADENRLEVGNTLKKIQRITAISPKPEYMGIMLEKNLHSATYNSRMSKKAFVAKYAKDLGTEVATNIHDISNKVAMRNQHILMNMRDAARDSQVDFIDKGMKQKGKADLPYFQQDKSSPLSYEKLFGSANYCECGHCNSVYSPSAYFVELLQYLRNNNLDPDYDNTGSLGYAGTPLEQLFWRRPDLKCLQLTCENAFTVLPYIDLSNEVMECYVAHNDNQKVDRPPFKLTTDLETFNTHEEDESSILLAQPQNIHKKAYCTLNQAVYPFTLPYNQPLDSIRQYLDHLDLTRYDLMKKFRSYVDGEKMLMNAGASITPAKVESITILENQRIDNALCAEYLNLSEEEYVIISKEGFANKEWYELQNSSTLTEGKYQDIVGVKPLHDYYFTSDDSTLLSELKQLEKQFMPRTGLSYVETVDLLNTFYINPYQPLAEVQNILKQINLPYRFLQQLVNHKAKSISAKYKDVISVIHTMHNLLQLYYNQNPDPCSDSHKQLECLNKCDIEKWVYYYFEKIGKLIVLDGGEAFRFKYPGKLVGIKDRKTGFQIDEDGDIINDSGEVIGKVHLNNQVEWYVRIDRKYVYYLINGTSTVGAIGFPRDGKHWEFKHIDSKENPISFKLYETCDISNVTLQHLDGTPLENPEWDKIHRFIRLWRKLGWKMSELDSAILGSNSNIETISKKLKIEACIEEDIKRRKKDDCGCSKLDYPRYAIGKIDGKLICDLAMLIHIQKQTNIKLPTLLSFWSEIESASSKSLYSKLFLRKSVSTIDPVFNANGSGYYLQDSNLKISNHSPSIMAALNITDSDISLLNEELGLNDVLDLVNISRIYRHQVLSRNLKITIQYLLLAKSLFGDPFTSPSSCIRFLELHSKMKDAGLSIKQMAFIFSDVDELNKPLRLSLENQLQVGLEINNAVQGINEDHKDITQAEYSYEILSSKLNIVYEEDWVSELLKFIQGEKNFTTNVPPGLSINIDSSVTKKITYTNNGAESKVTLKGILSSTEENYYQSLSSDPSWIPALDRIKSQWSLFFEDYLFDLITATADKTTILSADDTSAGTDINKGFLVLSKFLPKLRSHLEKESILGAITSHLNFEGEVLGGLMSEILNDGNTPPQFLMEYFKLIGDQLAGGVVGQFDGKLIPQVSDEYIFVVTAVTGSSPGVIYVDQKEIDLNPLSDPTNVHVSEPIALKAGTVYNILLSGFDAEFKLLKWKTSTKPSHDLMEQVLVPNYLAENFENNFRIIQKADIILSKYNYDYKSLLYMQVHGSDFSGLDFNNLTIEMWERLHDLDEVIEKLEPSESYGVFEFFRWSKFHVVNPPSNLKTEIIAELKKLTSWESDMISSLIEEKHLNLLDQSKLINEVNLKKLIQAKEIKETVGVDIEKLFYWAVPNTSFDHLWAISYDLQQVVKARYILKDWEEIVKPINDKIRTHQRNSLINYLLNQEALRKWGVKDKDSLFEFFLIDVQMEACMETSRIKQAISSAQLFIQRCFLNLESHKDASGNEIGISNEQLDRDRWDWMSRYRIWEANRKVFLYPENWIRTELRDDKSSIYEELESELLQKDVNSEMVKEALTNYLYKLDEVADLKVVGIYVKKDTKGYLQRLHVVSRTRNAPYFFFYRKFEHDNWYPWEKIQVDIPSYDLIKNEQIVSNGTYVMPVEFNNRVFVFFPQFLKKTKAKDTGSTKFEDLATDTIKSQKPTEVWEIKMGYTQKKNNVWQQKVISDAALYRGVDVYLSFIDFNTGFGAIEIPTLDDVDNISEIQKFEFQLLEQTNNLEFRIKHNNYDSDDIGPYDYFSFDGRKISIPSVPIEYLAESNLDNFGYKISTNIIFSANDLFHYFDDDDQIMRKSESVLFKHDFSLKLLEQIHISDLKSFFNYANANRINSGDQKPINSNNRDDFGRYTNELSHEIFHELKSAYSIYNWELFFHLPMAIAENLTKNQRFEEAMQWYHFVFDPYKDGVEDNRYWKFLPFRHTNAKNYLESFFAALKDNQSNEAINEWRNNPFNPHMIARSRPTAYMKWTVMKYLDNILEWGDYLFRQDSIESVNYASQLYILAGHILGRRPQIIPKRGKIKPLSYVHIMNKLDAFSMASTELELVFPFSNQTEVPLMHNGTEVTLANIYGLSTTEYFCIPNNPKLMSYWDTFSDRLYKIRHCLNIEGIFRKLSLFEPPIDPALLVAATAQGLSLSSVLNDLNGPVPNYRFSYLLQKSFELTNEVKSLGNTLLSLKEKKDGERISIIRAKHEVVMNNLIMDIKKKQLEESQKSLDSLVENRKSPVYRMQYNLQLIGEDLSKIPSEDSDYSELADKIEQVIDDSGLKLIGLEKEELTKSAIAARMQNAASIIETIAGLMHVIPDVTANTQPMGAGVSTKVVGGSSLGPAMSTGAKVLGFIASEISFQSSNAARKAGFTRQLQDRIQQANLAGREIKQIDKQIVTQKIRIELAQKEIDNHQQQIDNSKEAEEFLKTKYTNEQLYSWMEGQIKTLFYQSYKLAYDLAKKVEGLYRFEKGLSNSNFIQYGYWNSARDGLLSGEQLYLGLKQIEQAHQENRGHDFEIPNKQISLRKLSPEALLELRSTGSCEFVLPEELFDLDFPGQLQRRIKTVSFSIPCIAGPYTAISAKVNMLEHSFRIDQSVTSGYPRAEGTDDERFLTMNIPINSVSLSSAQNDGGVFELNFRDERYMPFEGAGVISKWRLELPDKFRQFDYDTISDIIINLAYTSNEGGQELKLKALEHLTDILADSEGYSHYALFDLKHDFSQEWYAAMSTTNANGNHELKISDLKNRLPYLSSIGTVTQDGLFEIRKDDNSVLTPTITPAIQLVGNDDFKVEFDNPIDERLWLIFKYKLTI